jgi:hypothetical protein
VKAEKSGHDGAKHAIHEVRSFELIAPYTLCVCFEDGTAQTIDFQPVLAGELYGPTGPTSTRPRCTIGRSTSTKCVNWHGALLPCRLELQATATASPNYWLGAR